MARFKPYVRYTDEKGNANGIKWGEWFELWGKVGGKNKIIKEGWQ